MPSLVGDICAFEEAGPLATTAEIGRSSQETSTTSTVAKTNDQEMAR
jgi:hypothetical protein